MLGDRGTLRRAAWESPSLAAGAAREKINFKMEAWLSRRVSQKKIKEKYSEACRSCAATSKWLPIVELFDKATLIDRS